jgi:fatty acid desaturase
MSEGYEGQSVVVDTVTAGSAPDGDGLDAVRRLISRDELAQLNRIKGHQVILRLGLTWTAIIAALEAAILADSMWAWFPAFVAMGCIQNALILWTHEASHYGLTRNKRLNDLLGDVCVSGPAGVTVAHYRWQHVMHHRYLGDPEKEVDLMAWRCVRGGHLLGVLVQHLAGVYAVGVLARYRTRKDDPRYGTLPPRSLASVVGFVGANSGLFLLCTLQGCWYLYFLLWLLPLLTLALAIGNLRTIVEHQPSSEVCDRGLVKIPAVVRVVRYGLIGRFCLAPLGFAYHIEHHAFPGIPHHRLRTVRQLLTARGCFQLPEVIVSAGYFRTLWQIAMQRGYGVPIAGRQLST